MSAESTPAKIAMARKLGWSVCEMALANVYGATERRELVARFGTGVETKPGATCCATTRRVQGRLAVWRATVERVQDLKETEW
jgi:hypothetical protein